MKERMTIAGLSLDFQPDFPSRVKELYSGYLVHNPDDKPADIELKQGPWIPKIEAETNQSPESVEFYAFSVALGDKLPLFNRLQTHGVAIEYEGKAYIFSAPSGTGKSTRAFIWQQYLGSDKVTVINGDKPILWFREEEVLACGSPWSGKEGLQKNVCVPLGGLCLLQRSPENTIRRADPEEYLNLFINQIQIPESSEGKIKALSLMDELYSKVPVYILKNDRTKKGFEVSFEALTGKSFD